MFKKLCDKNTLEGRIDNIHDRISNVKKATSDRLSIINKRLKQLEQAFEEGGCQHPNCCAMKDCSGELKSEQRKVWALKSTVGYAIHMHTYKANSIDYCPDCGEKLPK